jgi:hypothetical protein
MVMASMRIGRSGQHRGLAPLDIVVCLSWYQTAHKTLSVLGRLRQFS